MSHEQLYEGAEPRYRGNAFGVTERFHTAKQRRPTYGRRRGKTPQSFNGIHRRRRRKVAW